MASNKADGSHWCFTYPLPANFADHNASGFTTLSLNSNQLETPESKKATDWGAASSGSWGLWITSASASGHHAQSHSHMDASTFSLNAEISVVRIFRP